MWSTSPVSLIASTRPRSLLLMLTRGVHLGLIATGCVTFLVTPQVRLNAEGSATARFVANERLFSRVRVMMNLETRRPREALAAPCTLVLGLARRDGASSARSGTNAPESTSMLCRDDTVGHAC